MTKLCVLALLLYNTVITISSSSEYNVDSYDDRADDVQSNLLRLFEKFNGKSRENRGASTESPYSENWTWRWMPDKPNDPTPPPKILPALPVMQSLTNHMPMGKSDQCDDGKTNLEVDWDNSPVNYTCYGEKITPEWSIRPKLYSETIPFAYTASHKCMSETIEYDDDIPLYGPHRPVWPVNGEYKFLPKQRWIHSLEHGGVVMLYHPCANPLEKKRLKTLVKNCLRRHVISPYSLLDEDRPLALVTWGSRLTMSYVNPEVVKQFIRNNSLRGPEDIPQDGEFEEGLLSRSNIVTDISDSTVCPNM